MCELDVSAAQLLAPGFVTDETRADAVKIVRSSVHLLHLWILGDDRHGQLDRRRRFLANVPREQVCDGVEGSTAREIGRAENICRERARDDGSEGVEGPLGGGEALGASRSGGGDGGRGEELAQQGEVAVVGTAAQGTRHAQEDGHSGLAQQS